MRECENCFSLMGKDPHGSLVAVVHVEIVEQRMPDRLWLLAMLVANTSELTI